MLYSSNSRLTIPKVFVTILCMLAQTRNQHSSEFQTTICIYLLACGASRSQFDILSHAGFSLSYRSTIRKIKNLGQERMAKILGIAKTKAFMIIWDNLNIAFRVGEQRIASKDHFDNGTTATLIPLFGVEFGGLPLNLLSPRKTRLPVLGFKPECDLMPTLQQVLDLEAAECWHIEDILFDAFPELRERFKSTILPPPSILPIPLHKTEQHPLPTMHIDESSLDGTLEVFSSIFCHTLKMSSVDLQKHGVVLCAGDQLSISLLDKVSSVFFSLKSLILWFHLQASASRRDDSELMDSMGCFTKPQLGLFHAKVAGTWLTTNLNEHWGTPNSRSPWSMVTVEDQLATWPESYHSRMEG